MVIFHSYVCLPEGNSYQCLLILSNDCWILLIDIPMNHTMVNSWFGLVLYNPLAMPHALFTNLSYASFPATIQVYLPFRLLKIRHACCQSDRFWTFAARSNISKHPGEFYQLRFNLRAGMGCLTVSGYAGDVAFSALAALTGTLAETELKHGFFQGCLVKNKGVILTIPFWSETFWFWGQSGVKHLRVDNRDTSWINLNPQNSLVISWDFVISRGIFSLYMFILFN